MELAPGSLLEDRYRIVRMLGSGSFGAVYEACDELLKRNVAIKFLKKPTTLNEEGVRRFLREGKMLAALQSPHLVRVYSTSEFQGHFYMVMELLNGETLRSILSERERLPEQDALQIAFGVAEALSVLESNGIVHRDLKPDNIMLVDDCQLQSVKVIDLGLAALLQNMSESQSITADGMVVGSVYYMCPESCLGAKADIRGDFYSLGCVLYESVTGRPPFEGTDSTSLLYQHVHLMPSEPQVPLSSGTMNLLTVLLQKDPNNRYSKCSDLLRAIEAAIESNGTLPAAIDANFDKALGRMRTAGNRWTRRATAKVLLLATAGTIGLSLAYKFAIPSKSIKEHPYQASINSVCEEVLQLNLEPRSTYPTESTAKQVSELILERQESSGAAPADNALLRKDVSTLEDLLGQSAPSRERRFSSEETKLLVRVLERLDHYKCQAEFRRLLLAMLRADYHQNSQSALGSKLVRNDKILKYLYQVDCTQRFTDKDFPEIMFWAGSMAPAQSLRDLALVYLGIFSEAKHNADESTAVRALPLAIRGLKELNKLEDDGADLYFSLGSSIAESSPQRAVSYMRIALKSWRDHDKIKTTVDRTIQGARCLAKAHKTALAAELLCNEIAHQSSNKAWKANVDSRMQLADAALGVLVPLSPVKQTATPEEAKLLTASIELIKPMLSNAADSQIKDWANSKTAQLLHCSFRQKREL